jgi:hypothetical protein
MKIFIHVIIFFFFKFCTYLKDSFDALVYRRIKDLSDFEWLRCFRVYLQEPEGKF